VFDSATPKWDIRSGEVDTDSTYYVVAVRKAIHDRANSRLVYVCR